MQNNKIKIITLEYNPITGTKTVEKEITVEEIMLQYNNAKKTKTEKAKVNMRTRQR